MGNALSKSHAVRPAPSMWKALEAIHLQHAWNGNVVWGLDSDGHKSGVAKRSDFKPLLAANIMRLAEIVIQISAFLSFKQATLILKEIDQLLTLTSVGVFPLLQRLYYANPIKRGSTFSA
jgi:hypothetical protein